MSFQQELAGQEKVGGKTYHRSLCTQKKMVWRGQRSTVQCPQCQAETEDKIHIVWCPAMSSRAQWTLSMQKLSC